MIPAIPAEFPTAESAVMEGCKGYERQERRERPSPPLPWAVAELLSSGAPDALDSCSNLADQQLGVDIHRPIAIRR